MRLWTPQIAVMYRFWFKSGSHLLCCLNSLKVGVFSGSACCIWGRKPTIFVSSSLFVGTVVLWYAMKNRCCFFPLDCIWTSSFWFFTNRFTDYFRSSTFGGEKTKRVLKSPNKHRLIRTVTVCLVSHTTACIHSCSYS